MPLQRIGVLYQQFDTPKHFFNLFGDRLWDMFSSLTFPDDSYIKIDGARIFFCGALVADLSVCTHKDMHPDDHLNRYDSVRKDFFKSIYIHSEWLEKAPEELEAMRREVDNKRSALLCETEQREGIGELPSLSNRGSLIVKGIEQVKEEIVRHNRAAEEEGMTLLDGVIYSLGQNYSYLKDVPHLFDTYVALACAEGVSASFKEPTDEQLVVAINLARTKKLIIHSSVALGLSASLSIVFGVVAMYLGGGFLIGVAVGCAIAAIITSAILGHYAPKRQKILSNLSGEDKSGLKSARLWNACLLPHQRSSADASPSAEVQP